MSCAFTVTGTQFSYADNDVMWRSKKYLRNLYLEKKKIPIVCFVLIEADLYQNSNTSCSSVREPTGKQTLQKYTHAMKTIDMLLLY